MFLKLSRIAETKQLARAHNRLPPLITVHGVVEEVPSEGNPSSPLAGAAEGFSTSADGDWAEVDAWPPPPALSNSKPLSQSTYHVVPDGSQARVPFPFFDADQLANHVFRRSDSGGEGLMSSNASHSNGSSSSVGSQQAVAPAPWTAWVVCHVRGNHRIVSAWCK